MLLMFIFKYCIEYTIYVYFVFDCNYNVSENVWITDGKSGYWVAFLICYRPIHIL